MHDLGALASRPVIVGAGIAGLMTALYLAPERVVLLSKTGLGDDSSSALAQGGLAASLGEDDDPALHLADTLAAGDGLCDRVIAEEITRAAPAAIEALALLGVRFDKRNDGRPALGLEAAHGRRRIIHAAGDGTGREIIRALVEAVRRTPSISVLEGFEVRQLLVDDGAVTGLIAAGIAGEASLLTERVVLATGGIGGLFMRSTNSDSCFGHGLVLAARAGAVLADLEFIQFHPTALAGLRRPAPLVSEAVRGEGAVLVDESGRRFLADVPDAELAPRDVVARGVWKHIADGHKVFLDARQGLGERFADRFPSISNACRAQGLDPSRQAIPVEPAVHYHMGGIAVDAAGRSSLPGLWACGEVACTGLHGANRLASNSLVEAAVCAGWVAESVNGAMAAPRRRQLPKKADLPPADPSSVREVLSHGLGVLRDEERLRLTIKALLPLVDSQGCGSDPALVGLLIAVAALRRQESRGAHWRTDFPTKSDPAKRTLLRYEDALATAREIESTATPAIRKI